MELQTALSQIDQADLSAAQYRAVRRLLDVATSGHAKLTKERCNELCCTTSDGATRRLLGGLQAAGLIHYSTNGFVYIDFTAWSPTPKGQEWIDEPDEEITSAQKSDHGRALLDHPRAELDHDASKSTNANLTSAQKSDHPRAEMDHLPKPADAARSKSARGRSKIDHPRALLDHNEAATYTHAHACELVSLLDPISSLEEQITNKLTADPESQALSFALLTHVRVKPAALAKELAALHPLSVIREAVSHWWFGRKSVGGQFEETPGVVVYWLKNWQSAGVPELSKHFYRTDLYLNYRTRDEIEADSQIAAQLEAPQPAPSPVAAVATSDPAPVDPHAAIWANVLAELKLAMPPATYSAWLHGATVMAVDGATWWIMAPSEKALDWLQNRLATKVGRILTSLTNQPVTVQFCLPEAR